MHPGTLDLKDNSETALKLFKLVNFIATKMITEPAEIDVHLWRTAARINSKASLDEM